MNRLSAKTGYVASLLGALTFVIYTFSFIAILMVNPLFTWTNLKEFVTYTNENNQFFKHLAEFSMVLFGILYVIMLSCIQDFANEEKKILARIGTYFGLAFAMMIGINYFVQLSAVRLNIIKEQTAGLEQFIQSNPTSGIAAINMLGWSLFLGISSLFIAPIFSGGKPEKLIKYAFAINGVVCLLGGLGYVFDIFWLVFITMNLGIGFTILVMTIALAVLFKRLGKGN